MSITILVIEDERIAAEKLIRHCNNIDADLIIAGICTSVEESVRFLKEHVVDLILSDIHLSDGQSFEIFRAVQTDVPIIFITAYDQYAIEAFKTNSIDYLLKPVKRTALEDALNKFKRLRPSSSPINVDFSVLMESLKNKKERFKERFLLETPNGELKTVQVSDVAYFYADGKYTFAICTDGKKYFSKDNISTLAPQLNPEYFFQLNRKFIAHIRSVEKIIKYSKSRLKLILTPPTETDVIVSTVKTPEFKEWLGQ